ncbi:hypothetical protein HMPREF1345_02080, partial [Enterococcus faecium TX1337RF]
MILEEPFAIPLVLFCANQESRNDIILTFFNTVWCSLDIYFPVMNRVELRMNLRIIIIMVVIGMAFMCGQCMTKKEGDLLFSMLHWYWIELFHIVNWKRREKMELLEKESIDFYLERAWTVLRYAFFKEEEYDGLNNHQEAVLEFLNYSNRLRTARLWRSKEGLIVSKKIYAQKLYEFREEKINYTDIRF